ncbi:MAG: hypothetical protein CR986_06825 [Ignavibacteriae bacterium]|nr:MAG: hypothetical protein CR986_06825 [Ignavibacteriota bacterium]
MKKILLTFLLFSLNCFAQISEPWKEIDSLNIARVGHAMVVLPNGNVLVSGSDSRDTINSAISCEIFDITTQKWEVTTPLLAPKRGHYMELLNSGEILAFGGATRTCQIFNPTTKEWRFVDSTIYRRNLLHGVYVKLNDGRIMLIGGLDRDFEAQISTIYNKCEIYNPETNKWTETEPMIYKREYHSAVKMADGKVLVTGGFNNVDKFLNTCEIYDPVLNTWTECDTLIAPRIFHEHILLDNGNILLLGGSSHDRVTGSAISINNCLLYNINEKKWEVKNALQRYRSSPGVFKINENTLILTGGDVPETWGIYDINQFEMKSVTEFGIQMLFNKYHALQLNNKNILIAGGEEWWDSSDLLVRMPTKKCFILDITTNVTEEKIIDNNFVLYQNYPNPFNPITNISYQIPKEGHVSLVVYNSLGQKVQTVFL